MAQRIYIVGCGGFGREVFDVVAAINAASPGPVWEMAGYVDDAPSEVNRRLVQAQGSRVVGGVDELLQQEPAHYAIGINAGAVRRGLDERLTAAGWSPATLVHPAAVLGSNVVLGAGTIVCGGSQLTTNITTGRHAHINLSCTVGHDVRIGDYVSINPLTAVSGWVQLGDEVTVGTHAAILQGLEVGAGATIGGSALVVKPVPAGVVAKGVPARW